MLRAFEPDVTLASSPTTLDEPDRVMRYDRLPFTEADRTEFLAILEREATLVEPTESVSIVDRDPADDAFLACAREAGADFLVTGDDHLLDLGQFEGVEIVTPASFVERVG